MATITRFEDLEIWQEARRLSLLMFELTKNEFFARDFKFRDQVRSSAGSVMDNIAEGFERSGRNEFVQFLSISKGSAGEIRSQLYRATDQKYIAADEANELIDKYKNLASQISGFIGYLNKSEFRGHKFKDRN
ncbi:MAG: four helix bundle protein [Chitinophagaceae bacterium]|nr:four helix bundle protein [Chitinophagaceae bacterium]